MKLNQKVNNKNPLINAKRGKSPKIETKGNITTFIIPEKGLDFDVYREISTTLLKLYEKSITFDLSSFLNAANPRCRFAAATALLSRIDAFNEPSFSLKTKPKKFEANILCNKADFNDVKLAIEILNGIHLARQFQILPNNYLGINDFAHDAKALLEGLNNKHLKIKILNQSDLKKEKMDLILGVNSGSNEPAKMMILEYKNSPSKDLLAYVGKGIMFDSGGYELKPSQYLIGMNQDMTGAATVFGTIYALAKTNAKANVVGFLPLAKNLINEKSMQVSDVYKACNGRTVEMVSPDAEGRLILADAIAYANKKYKISKIMTIATLSGLSSLAFGDYMTPCWSFKHETALKLAKISTDSLEHIVCLPFYSEFTKLVNNSSKVADCANNVKAHREASNATAAEFLRLFSKCPDFTHFDVAGTNEFKKFAITPLILTLYLFALNHFVK